MSPRRVILTAVSGAAALAWLAGMALVGQQRTDAHRLDNIETVAMLERGAR